MQTERTTQPMLFARLNRRALTADFGGGAITSDAGALLLGATDKAIGLVERFASCFQDGRTAGRIVHDLPTLIGQRVFGIALGYKDVVDHDALRHDPAPGPILGRLEARHPRCAPLAGKSTLNRLEHAPAAGSDRYRRISHDAGAIEDLFLDAHARPPARITLDLDATDDPRHGAQEGRLFHGYHDGYCYLPLYVFCGDHLLPAKLRQSNIDASAGAVEAAARIVARIRERWPRVKILIRADGGFAWEALMAWCEANRVDFLFGLARNARLVDRIHVDLAWAEEAADHKSPNRTSPPRARSVGREAANWRSFTPPAAGSARRFRGWIYRRHFQASPSRPSSSNGRRRSSAAPSPASPARSRWLSCRP